MPFIAGILGFVKPYLGKAFLIIAAVIAFKLYTDSLVQKGIDKANEKFEQLQSKNEKDQKEMETFISGKINDITLSLKDQKIEIQDKTNKTNTIILQEAAKDPSQTNVDEGITQGMLDAINAARKETEK